MIIYKLEIGDYRIFSFTSDFKKPLLSRLPRKYYSDRDCCIINFNTKLIKKHIVKDFEIVEGDKKFVLVLCNKYDFINRIVNK